jgi:hypothetical protein
MSEYGLSRLKINGHPSDVWYVTWWDGRSQRVSTGCDDRAAAERWLARWQALRGIDTERVTVPSIAPRRGRSPTAKVYFIRGEQTGLIKIGVANNPSQRLANLQTGSPDRLELLGCTPGSSWGELRLHTRFAHLRQHGEWFTPGEDLLAYIREHAQ